MNPINPLSLHPLSLLDQVRAWPVQSQQGARRNAMIATTALAARRAEREDVEDFFAALARSTAHQQLPLALHR
jgi:hypothetical protein